MRSRCLPRGGCFAIWLACGSLLYLAAAEGLRVIFFIDNPLSYLAERRGKDILASASRILTQYHVTLKPLPTAITPA